METKRNLLAVVCALLMAASYPTHGINLWSLSSGNWSDGTIWSTNQADPCNCIPTASDNVNIENMHVITIDGDGYEVNNINVGQGFLGTLQFANTGSYEFTIHANITVSFGGASLGVEASGSNLNHTLRIRNSITNFGTVNLNNGLAKAHLIFDGSGNSAIQGIAGFGTVWIIDEVTMEKDAISDQLDLTDQSFLDAANTVNLNRGTFVYNAGSTHTLSTSDYNIHKDLGIESRFGTLSIATMANQLILSGKLMVTGGTLNVGSNVGSNGIDFDQTDIGIIPEIEVSSGTLNVYGGISHRGGASNDPFIFEMSGGTVNLNDGASGTPDEAFFMSNNLSSYFAMSGGTIHIHKPSTGFISEFDLGGDLTAIAISGGLVKFGTPSAPKTFEFKPHASVIQPAFEISGAGGSILRPFSCHDFILTAITIADDNTFDVNKDGPTCTSIMSFGGNSSTLISMQGSGSVINPRDGSLSLLGAANRTIESLAGATVELHDLTMNTTGKLTLQAPVKVENSLSLTNGIIESQTGTNILTLGESATVTGGSNASYVEGPMRKLTNTTSYFEFPVGKSGNHRAIGITPGSTDLTEWESEYFPSAQAFGSDYATGIEALSSTEYWMLDRISGSAGGIVTMSWDSNSGVDDITKILVSKWDGSEWLNLGGESFTGDNSNGTVTATISLASFSPFTLASSESFLPIELSYFDAQIIEEGVALNWETATEINNEFFQIERSVNGFDFEVVTRIEGAGNSFNPIRYDYIDENALPGVSFYRLKQTDFDGTSSYSKIISILNERSYFSIYPNPGNGKDIYLQCGTAIKDELTLAIYNTSGDYLLEKKLNAEGKHVHLALSNSETLDPGIYLLNITTGSAASKTKLIVR